MLVRCFLNTNLTNSWKSVENGYQKNCLNFFWDTSIFCSSTSARTFTCNVPIDTPDDRGTCNSFGSLFLQHKQHSNQGIKTTSALFCTLKRHHETKFPLNTAQERASSVLALSNQICHRLLLYRLYGLFRKRKRGAKLTWSRISEVALKRGAAKTRIATAMISPDKAWAPTNESPLENEKKNSLSGDFAKNGCDICQPDADNPVRQQESRVFQHINHCVQKYTYPRSVS